VSPAVTTTYLVVLTDNCTSLSDSGLVTITVRDPLNAMQRSDTIICNGQQVNLFADATGGDPLNYTYNWDNGLGGGSRHTVQPPVTTTYRVIVSDNCTTLPDTGYATVYVRLPLDLKYAADTTICLGQSVPLFVDGSGGDTLAYTFIWDNGLGSGKSQLVSPLVTTTYKVVLVDNCTFKADTSSTVVTVRQGLSTFAGNDTIICHGGSVTLNATAAGGFAPDRKLTWDNGLGDGNNFTVSPAQTTTYQVVLSDNCTVDNDTDEVVVTVRTPLTINASPDTIKICAKKSVQLTATANGGISASYVYTWNNGVGTGKDQLVTPALSTDYIVTLTDGCSASASDTVKVTVEQLPVPDFYASLTTGCEPFETEFSNFSTYLPGSEMLISFGDGSNSANTDQLHKYPIKGSYSVSLLVVSPFGCRDSITKTNYITVNPTPFADFRPENATAKITSPIVNFRNLSGGADSYTWHYGDGDSYNTGDYNDRASHSYNDTGTFTVKLVSTNNFGCYTEKTQTVRVNEVYNFLVPNSFTPNGDGLNDDFAPTTLYTKRYELKIYSRWGEAVYHSAEGKPWNGRRNNTGEILPGGTYMYQFTTEDRDGALRFTSGIVTMLR
jgi:gliding motility-associated-like protein